MAVCRGIRIDYNNERHQITIRTFALSPISLFSSYFFPYIFLTHTEKQNEIYHFILAQIK